jgi:hypothetical protein
MNAKDAYKLGVASGKEAAEYGDFTAAELADQTRFVEACHEISESQRQFAGHPGYNFNREPNAEALWDAFDEGEAVGVRKGWRKRQRRPNGVSKRAPSTNPSTTCF